VNSAPTITPLTAELIPQVRQLMEGGAPFVRVRTDSDYWLYARLFSSSCPVALVDGNVAGAVIAFRSQDDIADVYVQDVMIAAQYRNRGLATALLGQIRDWAVAAGCRRIYLTSEPENVAAHRAWISQGFVNVPGDYDAHGVQVVCNYKGPGKDRAVYELRLATDPL
jgi:GNAT superfamily N-acetyltransferase